MRILGIETSADETAAAVVDNGTTLLSSVVASQMNVFAEYGGVIPEVAARSHIEVMIPTVEKALTDAHTSWDEIEAIAVTQGPGLIGSLMIGDLTAQVLAELKQKPLIPVNHIEAHAYASWLSDVQPQFPVLALTVSGGHTQLVLYRDHGDYTVLGRTRDDAAGEAFDKVAKIIGLPYPGGISISKVAGLGDDRAFTFPKPQLGKDSLEFSFSGLKTAVLRAAQAAVGRDFRTPSYEIADLLSQQQKYDIAASFQKTVVDILVGRVKQAADLHDPKSIVIGGGVAANQLLRSELEAALPGRINFIPLNLCTDNAAMIATLGYYLFKAGRTVAPSELVPSPVLSM